jgi:hypothetical protein
MSMKSPPRSSIRHWALSIVHCALLAAAAAGCAKARAETVPDGPPLATPPPPSRVFAPLEDEPLVSSPSPVADTTPVPAPNVPVVRPTPRRTTPAENEKSEPAPSPAPAVETRELSAASLPGNPESEKRIVGLLQNASRDLKGVDYGKLTRDGKGQYDQAKLFIEEAEKALKERNFVYAQASADRAAKLASELSGR